MEEEKLKGIIQNKFEIENWDSEEGKKKRNNILQSIDVVSKEITKFIGSSLSNREKARKVQKYVKGTGILATIAGVYQTISGFSVSLPFSKLFKGELNLQDLTEIISFGPTFWLKVALFLLVLKIAHSIISTGTIFIKDIGKTWNSIKEFFKKVIWKDVNEGFFSREEYEHLKLLTE